MKDPAFLDLTAISLKHSVWIIWKHSVDYNIVHSPSLSSAPVNLLVQPTQVW